MAAATVTFSPEVTRSPSSLGRAGVAALSRSGSDPGLLRDAETTCAASLGAGSAAELRWSPAAQLGNTAPASFLSRQMSHPSVEARRKLAARQKDLEKERRTEDDRWSWGAQGAKGFRAYLEMKYGSIIAAWRALDADGNGRLSFVEFCKACRKMGYHGDLKGLWHELDRDGNGQISVGEIAPEVGSMVGTFKLHLMYKYGDMLTAWQQGLDTNRNGRIDESEVQECVKRLGLSLDSKKLFGMLRGEHNKGLTFAEFDPDAARRLQAGDTVGISKKGNKEFIEDVEGIGSDLMWPKDVLAFKWAHEGREMPSRISLWRQELKRQDLAYLKSAVEANVRVRAGLVTAEGFKKEMMIRFGSLYAAWRDGLDLHETGRLTFAEFCTALRKMCVHGDLQALFRDIDVRDNGYIEFLDWDPMTDAVLTEFREMCAAKYGNMLLTWLKALDVSKTGQCDERRFVKVCKEIGFYGDPNGETDPSMVARRLFALLKPEAGRRFLTLQDFDRTAYRAMSRGDFRMLTQTDPHSKSISKLDMTFDERYEASYFFQKERGFQASTTADFSKSCRSVLQPEQQYDPPEDFVALCKRRFGSVVAAWRLVLDPTHAGKLNYTDLCAASRRLGFAGDLKDLWKKYDAGSKGFVTLADIDADADRLVNDFFDIVDRRYGGLLGLWTDCGADVHKSVSEEALAKMCEKIAFPHSTRKLFRCLNPHFGGKTVAIWDIEPLYEMVMRLMRGNTKASRARHDARRRSAGGGGACEPSSPSSPPKASAGARGVCTTGRTPENLRQLMSQNYASTVAAWCQAFDPMGRGFVTFCQFCQAMPKVELSGNVQGLWKQLAGERDALEFRAIDPPAQAQLDAFRQFLLAEFGSVCAGWHRGLNSANIKMLTKGDFQQACERMLAPEEVKPAVLFKLLLRRHGQISIRQEDLRSLLVGLPPQEWAAAWGDAGGRGRATAQPSASTTGVAATQPARGPGGGKGQEVEDVGVRSAAAFRRLLTAQFGSPFSAWRHALDRDQNGVVTLFDFCEACRNMGVVGAKRLFGELDTKGQGQIRLEDFHAETAARLTEFERLLTERYEHPREGWTALFDKDHRRRCPEDQFKVGCKELGYAGDAGRLFKLLTPEKGRKFLTYDDIWLDLNRNLFKTNARDVKSLLKTDRQAVVLDDGSDASA